MSKANNRRSFSVSQLQERLLSNPALAAANPGFSIEPRGAEIASQRPASAPLSPPEGKDSGKPGKAGKKRKEMNQTEREFGAFLLKRLKAGEIDGFEFEGIKLHIGDPCCWYCPDFMVYLNDGSIQIIEVKGGFIREDSLIKWKCAKLKYSRFQFQMWQKLDGDWRQLR